MPFWHKLWRSLKGDWPSFEALLRRDNDKKSSEPEVLRQFAADADNEYAMIDATIMRAHQTLRIPLILISHSGRSRSPIPVILITLFTMPEEGTADSMTWRWTATTDG
jgi:hypothetical protein